MKLVLTTSALLALLALDGTVQRADAFGVAGPAARSTKVAFGNAFSPAANDASSARRYATALAAEASKITMPALSSTMKEGRVVSWLKSEGDAIEAGEAIMVVESDKADMDVEAFEDGYLAKILIDEGDSAPVGDVVAYIAAEEDEIAEVAAMAEGGEAAAAPAAAEEAAPAAAAEPAAGAAAPDCDFSQIDMPALSSTMKEGKVVSWLKAEGDPIEAGEAIMVVESDKADMDVEAFDEGFLAAIITEEGESGAVGAPVALIASDEGDIPALQAYAATLSGAPAPAAAAPAAAAAAPAAAAPKPAAAAPAGAAAGGRVVASPLAKKLAAEKGVDLTGVAGTGPGGRITASDVETAAAGGGGGAAPAKPAAPPAEPAWTPAAGVVAATPTARALAKKAKLDLAAIPGTGKFGRVTADDVKIATGEKKAERPKPAGGAAAPVEMPSGLVPFTGMQRAVSNNMVATLGIPVFRATREIIMDDFDALYQSVKPKGVSVSALLAKAVALAVQKHPICNSEFSEEGTVFKPDVNIAMAVSIEGGLITPVLKYANERNVMELAENWKELVGKARTNTLAPDEYNSGTFTISNMGMFGVSEFAAILPQGQGCILAVAATQEKIVPDNRAILGMKKEKRMTVTLTCDHRQIYGSDAAFFLKTLADILENQSASLLL